MKYLLAAAYAVLLTATPNISRAEDITRFAPLKADELTPPQKAWADMIAAPPRNAKFVNPPYRAYIRNPDLAPRLSALSDYLRWNTSLPPRLSELAILITAREWTAQYEWFAHYPLALKGGLDPRVADAIAAGKRPDAMKDDEAALYDLAGARLAGARGRELEVFQESRPREVIALGVTDLGRGLQIGQFLEAFDAFG